MNSNNNTVPYVFWQPRRPLQKVNQLSLNIYINCLEFSQIKLNSYTIESYKLHHTLGLPPCNTMFVFQVTIVGVIRDAQESATNITYKVNDMTGEDIIVRKWIDNEVRCGCCCCCFLSGCKSSK